MAQQHPDGDFSEPWGLHFEGGQMGNDCILQPKPSLFRQLQHCQGRQDPGGLADPEPSVDRRSQGAGLGALGVQVPEAEDSGLDEPVSIQQGK
jgi:hypothetical protein